jgi:hypothetical protein
MQEGATSSPARFGVVRRAQGIAPSHAQLLYRVWDDSGQARERITIKAGTKTLGTVRVRLDYVVLGTTYHANWHVPLHAPRSASFCLTASDASGNSSRSSCAQLTLR